MDFQVAEKDVMVQTLLIPDGGLVVAGRCIRCDILHHRHGPVGPCNHHRSWHCGWGVGHPWARVVTVVASIAHAIATLQRAMLHRGRVVVMRLGWRRVSSW